MNTWQLQKAKAHFSEVVKKAITQGPQNITLRGESAVVVLAKTEFDRLKKPKGSFIQFIRRSPLIGLDLDLTRDSSLTREVDL